MLLSWNGTTKHTDVWIGMTPMRKSSPNSIRRCGLPINVIHPHRQKNIIYLLHNPIDIAGLFLIFYKNPPLSFISSLLLLLSFFNLKAYKMRRLQVRSSMSYSHTSHDHRDNNNNNQSNIRVHPLVALVHLTGALNCGISTINDHNNNHYPGTLAVAGRLLFATPTYFISSSSSFFCSLATMSLRRVKLPYEELRGPRQLLLLLLLLLTLLSSLLIILCRLLTTQS